jgi:hypothetical protein
MNFSMTGQEKGDLLIQVTSLTGLIVLANNSIFKVGKYTFASLTIINPKVTCIPFLCL